MKSFWLKVRKPLAWFILIVLLGGFGSLVVEKYIAPFLASQPGLRNIGFLHPNSPVVITKTEQIRVNENVSVRDLIKQLTPNVVTVIGGTGTLGRDFHQTGQWPGVALSSDGVVATDNTFLNDKKSSFYVVTADGQITSLQNLAVDPKTGVAILKANLNNLAPVQFGLASSLETGQQLVMLAGQQGDNSVHFQSAYVSTAPDLPDFSSIVSSESYQSNFNTDPKPNAGSLLYNLSGQLVGLTLASGKIVPAEDLKAAQDIYFANHTLTRPSLGLTYSVLDTAASRILGVSVTQGALVRSVNSGSPAAKANLQAGDIITQMNNDTVTLRQSLDFLLNRYKAGDTVKVTYLRSGQSRTVDIILGEQK